MQYNNYNRGFALGDYGGLHRARAGENRLLTVILSTACSDQHQSYTNIGASSPQYLHIAPTVLLELGCAREKSSAVVFRARGIQGNNLSMRALDCIRACLEKRGVGEGGSLFSTSLCRGDKFANNVGSSGYGTERGGRCSGQDAILRDQVTPRPEEDPPAH